MIKFIKKKPLLSYYICAFGFTWLIVFYLIFSGLADDFDNPSILFLIGAMISGVFPTISGILITRITKGKEGLKNLFSKFKTKSSFKWYFITLTILPIVTVITTIISNYTIRSYELYFNSSTLMLGLIWPFFSGFGEEFGWRGYVLPKYLSKYSVLKSALLLGVIWATWHLPMYYIGYKDYGQYTLPALLIPGYINLVVQSVIMTYLFVKNKGSIKIAILYHYTITSSALLVGAFVKSNLSEPKYTIYESIITITICIILDIILYYKNNNSLNKEKEQIYQ